MGHDKKVTPKVEAKKPVEMPPLPVGTVFDDAEPVQVHKKAPLQLEVLEAPTSTHDSASDPDLDHKYLKQAKKRVTRIRKKKIHDLNDRKHGEIPLRPAFGIEELNDNNDPLHETEGLPDVRDYVIGPVESKHSLCYHWYQKICCCKGKRRVEN